MTDRSEPDDAYPFAAGGWGSMKAVTSALLREGGTRSAVHALSRQNKPDGFACTSCAWAKPGQPHPAEFCENGAKATAWELTRALAPPAFFAAHPVAELRGWSDLDLESAGRVTAPMRYDAATDRYVEVGWETAFREIGDALRALRRADPDSVVFYTSGRASLEASYLWQLFARLYGTNNLPDSSNMCHESTSVALPQSIGVPVGTVTLEDFEHTDCVLVFGQNVGTNSPRMLHPLRDARRRGAPLIAFNPLREPGLLRFADPQSPVEMLTPAATTMSSQYVQLRVGGDLAAMVGLGKAWLELDDAARRDGGEPVLDHAFIAGHTHGFDAFADYLRGADWDAIEAESGVPRAEIEAAARTCARAKAILAIYGMGLTQQREGVLNVRMLANLLLMGGHVGRPGAGICPVRGHSNVQGQRTVGITEKPELAPLDRLAELYRFEPPRTPGRSTVRTCEGILDRSVRGFLSLGGNFCRAVPDTVRMEAAWPGLALQVHVTTKLNRTHLLPGASTWLLPCLGRIEIDRQASGEQAVAVESSTGHFHASRGVAEPAVPFLRSEVAIVAALARATLPERSDLPWQAWTDDYARIRQSIEATWPEVFAGFEAGFAKPGGLHRPLPARERVWKTPSGRAEFATPSRPVGVPPAVAQAGPDVFTLTTIRSDDQFNTTVYALDDRFRGVHGTREVLLMHPDDIARLGLAEDDEVVAHGAIDDGHRREVRGLKLRGYAIPRGCVAGYFPECNPLLPLSHHADGSHVPAAKSIPIRIVPMRAAAGTTPA